MKFLKRMLYLAVILIGTYNVYAQKHERPSFTAMIDKTVSEKTTIDSIVIKFYPNYSTDDEEVVNYTLKPNAKRLFTAANHPNVPGTVAFYICHGKRSRALFGSLFFFEPGDEIRLDLFKKEKSDSAQFIGTQAVKYNAVVDLNNLDADFSKLWSMLKLYNGENMRDKLQRVLIEQKEFEAKKAALINGLKCTSGLKKMLSYQYANFNERWDLFISQLYGYNFKNNEIVKSIVKQLYNENKRDYHLEQDETIAAKCSDFILAQLNNELTDQIVNCGREGPELKSYYDALKENHNGLMREMLIAEFFLGGKFLGALKYTPETMDSLTVDAEKIVKEPMLRQQLLNLVQLSKGKKIYNSAFQDLNNKAIYIDSLKGKVIFLDIWGLGCSACAVFHKRFEKDIFPIFKNDTNFVVLSIYNGKTKEGWLKGINSDLYTSYSYLNVSTNQLGSNHPFLKHYGIYAAPFLLLIDKEGRVFSQVNGGMDSSRIISLITNSLSLN